MWWNPFFISIASSPARLATPEASLYEDLLPGRWSTVTKSSSDSISFNISTPCDVQNTMWPLNTPRKHETLIQRWSNFGPPSATLAQHKTITCSNPANTNYLYNICTTLGQRRRSWADIVQMLYKCFVF